MVEDNTGSFQKKGRDLELERLLTLKSRTKKSHQISMHSPNSVSAEVNRDSADCLGPTLHTFVHTLAGGNPSILCNRHRVSSLQRLL